MYSSQMGAIKFKARNGLAILGHKDFLYIHVSFFTESLQGARLFYLKMNQKLFQNKDKKGYFRIFLY